MLRRIVIIVLSPTSFESLFLPLSQLLTRGTWLALNTKNILDRYELILLFELCHENCWRSQVWSSVNSNWLLLIADCDQTEMGDPSQLWQEYRWSETRNHIWRWWKPMRKWSSICVLEGDYHLPLSMSSYEGDWRSLDLSAMRRPWSVKMDRSTCRYTQCLWLFERPLSQIHKESKRSAIHSWSACRRWRGMFFGTKSRRVTNSLTVSLAGFTPRWSY